MPWCPNCRTEYRPGFTRCADCGAPLAQEPPALPPAPGEQSASLLDQPGRRSLSDPALLTNLPDSLQAGMLAGLLEENGLPSYIQAAGSLGRASALYLGFCPSGCDVYVERAHLGAAREFLTAYLMASCPQEEGAETLPWEAGEEAPAAPPDAAPGEPPDHAAYREYLDHVGEPPPRGRDPRRRLMIKFFLLLGAALLVLLALAAFGGFFP